jgi:hypothetical protein
MKRGWKIFFIVFLIFVLLVTAAGIYFYYFHVFYKIGICISSDSEILPIECENKEQCIAILMEGQEENSAMPEFLKEKVQEMQNRIIGCSEGFCEMKKVRSFNSNDECVEGEEDYSVKLYGKDILGMGKEAYNYYKQGNF